MSRALVLIVVLLAAGTGAWYVSNVASENQELRERLTRLERGGGAVAPRPAAPSAAPAAPGVPRTLSAEQRTAMLDALKGEAGAEKKVWFRVDPNDGEASGFEKALEDVFKEAGWEVQRDGNDGLVFKPGLYLFVAEEEWPSYAETAHKALEAAGFTVNAARGYREYYEQQSKEKPGWRGAKFQEGQTYLVLVGRRPET